MAVRKDVVRLVISLHAWMVHLRPRFGVSRRSKLPKSWKPMKKRWGTGCDWWKLYRKKLTVFSCHELSKWDEDFEWEEQEVKNDFQRTEAKHLTCDTGDALIFSSFHGWMRIWDTSKWQPSMLYNLSFTSDHRNPLVCDVTFLRCRQPRLLVQHRNWQLLQRKRLGRWAQLLFWPKA